jgi:hypothetical protein
MLGQLIRGEPCLFDNKISINEESRQLMEYKEKFKIFHDIEKGDKLGKKNETYYISKSGYTQLVRRWWLDENRARTWTYLDNDFNKFFTLCDTIKQNHLALTPNANIKKSLLEIINTVIPGLYNLKEAYKNKETDDPAKKLCCKIDSIILTLIDTKSEINKVKGKNKYTTFSTTNRFILGNNSAFSIPVTAVASSY